MNDGLFKARQRNCAIERATMSNNAAQNEKRKLEAAYLNNVAAGIIIVGGFLPVFAVTALETPPTNDKLIICTAVIVASWALSRILHKGALKKAADIED